MAKVTTRVLGAKDARCGNFIILCLATSEPGFLEPRLPLVRVQSQDGSTHLHYVVH